MVFLMVAMFSFAHDFEVNGIYYVITSSSEPLEVAVSFKGTSYSEYANEYTGTVNIPETVTYQGTTYSVTSIGERAFRACEGLVSISIPNSVTTVGSSIFYGCTSLTSITIPKGTLALYTNLTIQEKCCIYEVDNGVVWSETIVGVPETFSTYYDYDGDGVMEYLSCINEDKQYTYGFFDKNGIMKGTSIRTGNQYYDGSDYNILCTTPSNGSGELLAYWFSSNNNTIPYVEGHDELNGQTYKLLADIDNDGRNDLVEIYTDSKFTIHYQQSDGTFKALEQSATYDAETAAHHASSGNSGVVSFADGMMVKAPKKKSSIIKKSVDFAGSSSSYETSSCVAIDMNDDGILDLMNYGEGVLYSYNDNKFWVSDQKRSLFPCDLNGDGELDYICYDGNTITLQIRNGMELSKKTLFENNNVRQIVYKDFDHDGDIDVLVFINELNWRGEYTAPTYFVFFRNDGDLSFKRKERNFEAAFELKEIKDIDADGMYEMLIFDHTNELTKLLKIETGLSLKEFDFDFSDRYKTKTSYGTEHHYGYDNPIAIGDFDNDGKVDYRYQIKDKGVKYGYFSQAVNTVPQKMEAPTATLNAETGRLRINWKQGTDTETSACDLTYELRIGTQPASSDVLFGASLADGRRRLLDEGNMGRTLSTLFNAKSLKPGKYYISVQAVDGGGRGGAWSDDFIYEHQLSAPVIVSNLIDQMSTADTLQLSVKAPVDGATYQWTLSEGELLKSEGSNAECIFHHDGEHTINLAMTIDGRILSAEPLTIYVNPAKWVKLERDPGFIDINQDGYPEYLGYVNDGKGNLDKVLLSYVTNIPNGTANYMDFNMDGYPDAISENKVFINSGDQDNDFEMETQDFETEGSSYKTLSSSDVWFDANNDGHLDNKQYFNDGTNITWKKWPLSSPNYDMNRDGMLDIVVGGGQRWYVLYKDATADISYSAQQLIYETEGEHRTWWIEDVNNDGYADLLFTDYKDARNGYKLTVVKGSSEIPYTETVTIELPSANIEEVFLHDYNNDGYVDFHFNYYDGGVSKDAIIKFGPNFSMQLVDDASIYKRREPKTGTSPRYEKYFMIQKDGGYPDGYDSHITNQPPSAPATIAAKQTKDGLLITWSDAQDDHTPAMQMRYNVSVKRKGKKGDNSFVISPMNGLKDAATICGTVLYKKSTQMLVPASVLTAGETYEIQVQAIDLWNQHSPMTKAVEFTMTSDGYIDVAEQVVTDKETTVKFVGTNASSYSLNAGADATIVSDMGNGQFIVKWATEGVKELALTAGTKTVKSSVTVVKPVDLTFTVPAQVFADAPLTINVSDDMAAESKDVGIRVVDNSKVVVSYITGSKTATVTFPTMGTYVLEAYSNDAIRGGSYRQEVNVSAVMPKATIEQVDVDESTGFYAVKWSASALPTGISKVVVKKEGTVLGVFNEIATVDISAGRHVDNSSNPAVQSSRYCIELTATNGQTSEPSAAHKPLHVMIAKATQGYNLIWDCYEGIEVTTYNIMRGSSPNNLQQIAQVAGSINSYTDTSAPSGTCYYAVTFAKETAAARSLGNHTTATENDVHSNVISTNEAVDVVPAQSIELIVLDEDQTLNDNHTELQLYYLMLPTYATISKVAWEIIEGHDIAVIDANGRLHATGGEGTVTVRVKTIDGSNLSDEITVPCAVTSSSTQIILPKDSTDEALLVDKRYYSLDGKQINSPVTGQMYIEWKIYSNGQIVSKKLMKK